MNVMQKAWEMYKESGCTTKYEFSVALKIAHMMAKVDKIEDKLFMLNMIDRQSASDRVQVRQLQNMRRELQDKIGIKPISRFESAPIPQKVKNPNLTETERRDIENKMFNMYADWRNFNMDEYQALNNRLYV